MRVLAEDLLHAQGDQRLFDLALIGELAADEEILGDLLGDRRGADRATAVGGAHDVGDGRPEHGRGVDAGMAVEILVLRGEERVDHERRHLADRHEDALLRGVFGKQPAVAGMDAGDDRRLIIGELLVIRQIPAEIPKGERHDAGGDDANAHPDAEQEFDKELDDPHAARRRWFPRQC